MRRRQFLAAAAVATIPGFFARAFAAEGEDALRSVLAAPGRRPVLVVSLRLELAGRDASWEVVARSASSAWWALLFMEGAPPVMARLGQVDVTLADANVVRAVLHRDDDPWAVLVLPDGTAVAGTPDLMPPPAKVDPAAALQVGQQGLTDALARTCLSPDTRGQVEVVRDSFADRQFAEDPSMVGEILPFIDDVRSRVAAECGPDPALNAAVGGLRDVIPRRGPSDAELDGRLAAISAFVEKLIGGALGPVPAGEVDGLAPRAVGLLRERSPGNARWGIASGCGAAMDDGTGRFVSEPVECGMGHVTPRAARFLRLVVM